MKRRDNEQRRFRDRAVMNEQPKTLDKTAKHQCPRCSFLHAGEFYLCEGCRQESLNHTSVVEDRGMTPDEHDTFCAISDALRGGELGWVANLPNFRREAVSRIKDAAFWKRLSQKTTSLDALKAQFMEQMLAQAVELLRDEYDNSPSVDLGDFIRLYNDTWGKEED